MGPPSEMLANTSRSFDECLIALGDLRETCSTATTHHRKGNIASRRSPRPRRPTAEIDAFVSSGVSESCVMAWLNGSPQSSHSLGEAKAGLPLLFLGLFHLGRFGADM